MNSMRALYTGRRVRFQGEADALAARSRRISHLRAITFIALLAAGLLLERNPGSAAILLVGAAFLGFCALVIAHRRLRAREQWQRELAALNDNGLSRLDRAWDQLPVRLPTRDVRNHPYADDLDIFGRASVAQLLGPGSSTLGAAVLDDWLLNPATADVVRARQQAASELAPMIDVRERIAVYGLRSHAARYHDVDRFLQWAEREPWFSQQRGARLLAWLLPAILFTLLALHLTGITGPLWLIAAIVNAIVGFRFVKRAHHEFNEAFGREGMFEHFPDLLDSVADVPYQTPLLRSLAERVRPDGVSAREHIADLRRIMHLADVRASSLYPLIQIALLWDFHVMAALDRWQRRYGRAVRDWLQATAEIEALCALATLHHDEPEWTFPEIDDEAEAGVVAAQIAHPLIRDDVRVANDIQVGPPGTFVLITGSNMSGKSTLLRSIGVNVVLAQTGAPVCARRLVITPLRVRTSIHIQDSLARGVSYFMAELERLKQVVDAADAAGHPVLFLLDEILHGTNTAERRIAARRVIRHLLRVGSVGAVTTHDLELIDDAALAPSARLVHFQETFASDATGGALSFDYQLRDGLATSTNALKLMRYVGLPDD